VYVVIANRPGISGGRCSEVSRSWLTARCLLAFATGLMARVGPERHQDALAMPSVRIMGFTGSPMKGYVYLDPPAISADRDLRSWVLWCVEFVEMLPQRKAK
jgi:hypothetical protein